MKRLIPYGTLAILLVFMGLLARIPPDRMPQALAGGDFLSVLLGDAKKDISSAMLRQADSYFHGGVDMDCHQLHDHDHGHGHDLEHGLDRDQEHVHDDGEEHSEGMFDPWRWINAHVRAPEIDRHLASDKAVEMMPWFWVAIKADPHNVEAWSMAWYTASHMMKDETLALRIAAEGRRLNPESLEMTCLLGRAYSAKTIRDPKKAEAMFRAVVKMAGKTKELEENDYLAFFSAVAHLADSAKNRKDAKDLSALLEAARRINPDHPITRFVEQALGK